MADDRRSYTWLWVLLGAGAFVVLFTVVFSLLYFAARADRDRQFAVFGDKIAVVDLDGVIIEPGPVVKSLRQFADDDSIKAIILHLNTPGGGAAASQEIYSEVRRIRDQKKKRIVAS